MLVDGNGTTLSGQSLRVNIEEGNPPVLMTPVSEMVNFITSDIQGTIGVIHLIDGVLLPDLK